MISLRMVTCIKKLSDILNKNFSVNATSFTGHNKSITEAFTHITDTYITTTSITNTTTMVTVIVTMQGTNGSSIYLIPPLQRYLLARGPKFVVVPRCPLKGEYTAAVEEACFRLPSKTAAELRLDTQRLINKVHPQAQHHHTGIKGPWRTYNRLVQGYSHSG